MFKLEHIDHVALTVRDVEKSVAWYGDVLGLERRHQEEWGSYPAVMCAGETGVALFPAEGRSLDPPPDPGRTAAMRHLAFRVDGANFGRAQADLRGRGIVFSFEDHGITQSIYFHDPDGHMVEITTYEVDATRGG